MAPFTVNRRLHIVISRPPASGEKEAGPRLTPLARLKLVLGGLLLAAIAAGVLIVALTLGLIIVAVLWIFLTAVIVSLMLKRAVRGVPK